MEGNYISVRVLADRLARHPMLAGVKFEAVVDHVVDFLRIVNIPAVFEERAEVLEIRDHRAALPCGFVWMEQVRPLDREGRPVPSRAYREGADSFIVSPLSQRGERPPQNNGDLYYRIQGGFIYTSEAEGRIEVVYRAVMTDGEGLPVLPDDAKFLRAVEAYIKKWWFTILFDLGRINMYQLNVAQQDYAFAVGAAQNEFASMNVDRYESLLNSFVTLVPRYREHDIGFVHDGEAERIRVQ